MKYWKGMQWFKADLHIHSVLSPCGGLDMSPVNIIRQAVLKKLDIIAITDHNSTRHCRSAREIGKKNGITVLAGAEINTREEIHCLTFFESIDKADFFQQYIDLKLIVIRNNPDIFGHQFIVDEQENILEEENRLLVASLDAGIEEVAHEVFRLGGLFIPAHINRKSNGIYSQIGFIPASAGIHGLEISLTGDFKEFLKEHPETEHYGLITNSDAHSLEQIGSQTTNLFLENPEFAELVLALRNENGRSVRAI
jgi:PHP family Zn ribbon phosphoesterase